MKTMKFAPSNFPGKAVVATGYKKNDLSIAFGDANDPQAMTIFIDGSNIVNANALYQALDVKEHKKGNSVFCMKESDSDH